MALLLSLGGKYAQEIILMVVANCPLRFEVRVQVEFGGYQVAWTMDELPGMRVPIHLDSDQQLVPIAHGQFLLVDSSGMDRTFPLQVQEEALIQAEEMG